MDKHPQEETAADNSPAQLEGKVDFSPRAILALALPALGSLVIEPLLTLIDSVMVGHLGVRDLAGLSLASTILNTLVGVFVFLAYSTTARTAVLFGAGKPGAALRSGIDAIWLSLGLGIALVGVLEVTAPQLVGLLGADAEVAGPAALYLRTGGPGMIGMLVILAATGTLRGLLNTKAPLYVLAGGAVFNVLTNLTLIYGLGLGIAGAGIGLSLTQTGMAIALVVLIAKAGRKHRISWSPSLSGSRGAASDGFPLFIRTVSLRIALMTTVWIATQAGTYALAAHQVVNSIWSMAAFALDALAIAAQGLVGVARGARAFAALRSLVRRLSLWGVGAAVIIGIVIISVSKWLPYLFGTSAEMHQIATKALIAAGVLLPIGGLVFILDGVLIGAGAGKYLAWTGVVTLVVYLPALWWLHDWITPRQPLGVADQASALVWLWIAFAGWFMLARAITNTLGVTTGHRLEAPIK